MDVRKQTNALQICTIDKKNVRFSFIDAVRWIMSSHSLSLTSKVRLLAMTLLMTTKLIELSLPLSR